MSEWMEEEVEYLSRVDSAIDNCVERQELKDHEIENMTTMFEWMSKQLDDLSYEVYYMNSQIHDLSSNVKRAGPSKPVVVNYRMIDDHDQIQFCGPSTFVVKDHIKPLGATWIASSKMWIVSKNKGLQFMTEHDEVSFSQV